MADITDFDIGQGESFKILAHIFVEASSSIPLDITNYNFEGQLRENYTTDELAAEFNFQKVLPYQSGSVFIGLTAEQTSVLNQRMYVYDVVMINNNITPPSKRRILEGMFTIRPAVTRDY